MCKIHRSRWQLWFRPGLRAGSSVSHDQRTWSIIRHEHGSDRKPTLVRRLSFKRSESEKISHTSNGNCKGRGNRHRKLEPSCLVVSAPIAPWGGGFVLKGQALVRGRGTVGKTPCMDQRLSHYICEPTRAIIHTQEKQQVVYQAAPGLVHGEAEFSYGDKTELECKVKVLKHFRGQSLQGQCR